jgi:hypothetical protein
MKMMTRRSEMLAAVLALGAAAFFVPRAGAQQAAPAQKTFASPQDAVAAMSAALKVHDKAGFREIFGPEFHDLLTGDEAQDKANSKKFAKTLEEGANLLSEGDGKVILEIGAEKWPFPIPLVKEDSAWRFDTAAGKQEIIDRHVGKDEFHAIGACESYVPAQKKYATGGRGSSGAAAYAQRFASTPGKMDGLYWKTELSQEASPFGAKMAAAGVDGANAAREKPYHGYFFRILTRQGAAAPGGMLDYLVDGRLTGGFAMVAYPERWGRSGIMTFIVNQDGKIYQRDLGEKSSELAAAITEYDPGDGWSVVKDHGVLEP